MAFDKEDTKVYNDIIQKLQALAGQIDNLRLQQGILEGIVDSERGTVSRSHDRIHKEIEDVNKKMHEIVFDREKGLAFLIDRLIEKDKKREEQKKQHYALWVCVIGLIIREVIQFLK